MTWGFFLSAVSAAILISVSFQNCGSFETGRDSRSASLNSEQITDVSETILYPPAQHRTTLLNVLSQPTPGAISPNQTYVILWSNSARLSESIEWDVGRYTGFTPGGNVAEAQLGVNNLVEGSTTVQLQNQTIGMHLNTEALIVDVSQGGKVPMVIHYDFSDSQAPRPFAEGNGKLSYAFELQVPHVKTAGQGAAQVVAYMYFRNASFGFWLGARVFDSRPDTSLSDLIRMDECDQCTQQPIVTGPVGVDSLYRSKDDSEQFATTTWKGFRRFRFTVTHENFAKVLEALNFQYPDLGVSQAPENFELTHFELRSELELPSPAAETDSASLGLSVRNIKVSSTTTKNSRPPVVDEETDPEPETPVEKVKVPIYRFYKPAVGNHFFTADRAEGQGRAGYVDEDVKFQFFRDEAEGLRVLYRCLQTGFDNHYLSADPNCEGSGQAEVALGFVSVAASQEAGKPLYRCVRPEGHLATLDQAECVNNAFQVESILGYVP